MKTRSMSTKIPIKVRDRGLLANGAINSIGIKRNHPLMLRGLTVCSPIDRKNPEMFQSLDGLASLNSPLNALCMAQKIWITLSLQCLVGRVPQSQWVILSRGESGQTFERFAMNLGNIEIFSCRYVSYDRSLAYGWHTLVHLLL